MYSPRVFQLVSLPSQIALDSTPRNIYKRRISFGAMRIQAANPRLTLSRGIIVRAGVVRVSVGHDCSG